MYAILLQEGKNEVGNITNRDPDFIDLVNFRQKTVYNKRGFFFANKMKLIVMCNIDIDGFLKKSSRMFLPIGEIELTITGLLVPYSSW